jgi:cell division protein FtsA
VAERAYLSVSGLVPAPYASSLAVTTAEESAAGVLSLDFGAGTTSIARFVDGHLLASEVVPVGGNHLTFDLARTLQTSVVEAERIKVLYGRVGAAAADDHEPISFAQPGESGPAHDTTKGNVREVVHSRVAGLLGQIGERVERAGGSHYAIQYVVITGGASQLAGLPEFASEFFRKPVRLGEPANVRGLLGGICNPALSTAIGLARVAGDPSVGVRRETRSFKPGGYLKSVGRWLQASF